VRAVASTLLTPMSIPALSPKKKSSSGRIANTNESVNTPPHDPS
jgi:hypothetical protein